jgi:dihydroorotase
VFLEKITIRKPDDWHLHLREGDALQAVALYSARQFARAIIMPNLQTPVRTVAEARRYYDAIMSVVGQFSFQPLMTLYMTDQTTPEQVEDAAECPLIHGIKLYPAGATTNSEFGVTNVTNIYPTLAAMEEAQLPLLVHGEVTRPDVDVFDREQTFIDEILAPMLREFPRLKMVLEHITTRQGVEFVMSQGENVAGTITPQHLLLNRNALFAGGMRPHHFCLPVLKREQHRVALVEAATSGHPNFFLGTDSAPHSQSRKESACGCAGIFSAHCAIELYAEVFDEANAMQNFEAFASINGPEFYGLPPNEERITLTKTSWTVPPSLPFGDETLIPFRANEEIKWKIQTH